MSLLLLSLLSLGVITAVVVSARIVTPLRQLTQYTTAIGAGKKAPFVEEYGDSEIKELMQRFNLMNQQIQVLLANRTTLLMGVSHDIRSPLARIRLALEMLKNDNNRALTDKVEKDIESMDAMIEQFLLLAKGLAHESAEECDLGGLINQWIDELQPQPPRLSFQHNTSDPFCYKIKIQKVALHQVIQNLVENALKYSDKTVDLRLSDGTDQISDILITFRHN